MKICVNAADSVKDKSKETIPWKEHLSSWFYLSDSLLPRASRVAEPSKLPWQSPFIWDDRKPPLLNLDGKQFELDPARAQKKSPERHVTIWHRFVLKRTTVSCFFCVCFKKRNVWNISGQEFSRTLLDVWAFCVRVFETRQRGRLSSSYDEHVPECIKKRQAVCSEVLFVLLLP